MKRRSGKSSSSEPARSTTTTASASTLSPPVLSHSHSQFMQVAVQEHLADLREVATSAHSLLASPSIFTPNSNVNANSNSNSNANSADRNKPVTLPNKCIILGPGPAPVRRITDWESNNSHKPHQGNQRRQPHQNHKVRHQNGKGQRRQRAVDNNNKRATRRKKRPRIPPPNPHMERDLFYVVHLTSCQIGSHLLCPPPPTDRQPRTLPFDSLTLTSEDSLVLQRYREMRQQFNTGFSLSTLATLHQQLQSKYCNAIEILAQSTNPETTTQNNNNKTTTTTPQIDGSNERALTLRNEIAGLWILYTHVLLEIGLCLCQQQEQEQLQQRQELQREQCQQSPSKQDQGINLTGSIQHQQQQVQQQHQGTYRASSTLTTQEHPDQLEHLPHQDTNLAGYAQPPSPHEQQQQQQNQENYIANSTCTKSPFAQTEHPLPAAGTDATLPAFSFHDVLKYVLAVLQAAGQCPMVGNHKYIALSLGRLMVVETVLGASAGHLPTVAATIQMKSQVLRNSITDAVATCHQTLELCHGTTLKNQEEGPKLLHHPEVVDSIEKLCNYLANRPFTSNNGTNETWLTSITIKQDMLSILALPDRLRRKANLSTLLTKDSHTAKILCHEVNRWCRLREKLEKRLYTRIAPCLDYRSNSLQSVMATQILDQFQFYRTMDCPTDMRLPGAKWTDLEYTPPGENGGLVQWNW